MVSKRRKNRRLSSRARSAIKEGRLGAREKAKLRAKERAAKQAIIDKRAQPKVIKKEPRKAAPTIEAKPAVIKAKPKEPTVLEQLGEAQAKIITSPKTTLALVAALGTLLTFGGSAAAGAAAAGGRGVITRTAMIRGTDIITRSLTTQRAFVGKAAQHGVEKIFHAVKPIASRFATNQKSIALTTSMFTKIMKVAKSPAIIVSAIGSYPFAGFIKEEALQVTGFGFNTAERNNDIEGMELAIEETQDILNTAPSLMSKVPYANVLTQLVTFFEAVETKLKIDVRALEKKRAEQEEGETDFQRERRESDEAAFERKREFAAEEEERFAKIDEERTERREKQREEEAEFFEGIDAERAEKKARDRIDDAAHFAGITEANRIRELEERLRDSEYFNLIREGKFEEAEALLQSELDKLKGGGDNE